MHAQNLFLNALLAITAAAAPMSSLDQSVANQFAGSIEKRGERCETRIYIERKYNTDDYWKVWVKNLNSGQELAYWEPKVKHQRHDKHKIDVPSKGTELWVGGEPEKMYLWFPPKWISLKNQLSLEYGDQKWTSKDCRDHIFKGEGPSNGWVEQYDWWCEFDC